MKLRNYFLLALLLSACASRKAPPPESEMQWKTGELILEKQPKQNWCAISTARAVLSQKFEARVPLQCEMASKVHGEDCCKSESFTCGKHVRSEQVMDAYGFEYMVDHFPTFDSVLKELKLGKPVIIYHYFRHGDAGASTHAVVAVAAWEKDGKTEMLIYDPLYHVTKVWDSSFVTGNLAWDESVVLR